MFLSKEIKARRQWLKVSNILSLWFKYKIKSNLRTFKSLFLLKTLEHNYRFGRTITRFKHSFEQKLQTPNLIYNTLQKH